MALIFPSVLLERRGRRTEIIVMLVSLFLSLGLGYLFSRWFLDSFSLPR